MQLQNKRHPRYHHRTSMIMVTYSRNDKKQKKLNQLLFFFDAFYTKKGQIIHYIIILSNLIRTLDTYFVSMTLGYGVTAAGYIVLLRGF